jgi:hypothetical protein
MCLYTIILYNTEMLVRHKKNRAAVNVACQANLSVHHCWHIGQGFASPGVEEPVVSSPENFTLPELTSSNVFVSTGGQ